jgi:NADPH:quinone reductase-like Zn-dependent oxidoreductase
MIGGSTGRIFQIMFLAPLISRFGSKEMGVLMHRPNKKDLNKLKELFEAGKVMPVIDRHYPLSEVAEAFRYFGEGQVIGKLVIKVVED